MIDLRHPLVVLAGRLPWSQIEAALAPAFARKNRLGRIIPGSDLFGTTLEISGAGISAAGRPRLPIRLMAALLYLKHAFNLSDEELVARWSENVVWQYFSGQDYYTPTLPCDAILLEDVGREPKEVVVDLGFRGVDRDNPQVQIIHRGKYKSLTRQQRRWLKRRQAVEPAIGHLKSDHRMDRCWLKGQLGDALHAVLCATGYNLRWLLRAMVRLGLKAVFLRPVLRALMRALSADYQYRLKTDTHHSRFGSGQQNFGLAGRFG